MSRITDPKVLALAASDEEAWDAFKDNEVYMQRVCPSCDRGLVYTPGKMAQFCNACKGSGLLTRLVKLPWMKEEDEDDDET